ncbi:MAG: AI-2E family transporter [Methylococcales bacterium]|nr:AI-2E family transporter [Methylococcales bacterium]MBT7443510.1 AI-2E family transporter [Methylococcales bacterium]
MLCPEPYTFDRVIRITFHACFLAGVLWLINYLSAAIVPLVIGLLLAYLLDPLVNWVQIKIPKRELAVVASLTGISLILIIITSIITPMVSSEIKNMDRILNEFSSNADWKQRAEDAIPDEIWSLVKKYGTEENIHEITKVDNIIKVTGKLAEKMLPETLAILEGTASFVLGLISVGIILIYLFFLLIDFGPIAKHWENFLPDPYRPKIIKVIKDFDQSMSRFFRAQALVSTIMGTLFAIGFALIGLPMSILLGLMFGVLSMVPYLQLLGLIPAFILAVFAALDSGSSFFMIIMLTSMVFILIQLIQDFILTPRIMGEALGLRPALIIFSLSVWGQLLGLLGLIIALPLTQLLLSYYRNYLERQNTPEPEPEPDIETEPGPLTDNNPKEQT